MRLCRSALSVFFVRTQGGMEGGGVQGGRDSFEGVEVKNRKKKMGWGDALVEWYVLFSVVRGGMVRKRPHRYISLLCVYEDVRAAEARMTMAVSVCGVCCGCGAVHCGVY